MAEKNDSNLAEWSVSELSGALKRMLEGEFAGRIPPAMSISQLKTRPPKSMR
jgi:hypothetical protein